MSAKNKITDILNTIFTKETLNICKSDTKHYFEFLNDDSYLSSSKHALTKDESNKADKSPANICDLVKRSFSLPNPNIGEENTESLSCDVNIETSSDRITELISKNYNLPKTFDVNEGLNELLKNDNQ